MGWLDDPASWLQVMYTITSQQTQYVMWIFWPHCNFFTRLNLWVCSMTKGWWESLDVKIHSIPWEELAQKSEKWSTSRKGNLHWTAMRARNWLYDTPYFNLLKNTASGQNMQIAQFLEWQLYTSLLLIDLLDYN